MNLKIYDVCYWNNLEKSINFQFDTRSPLEEVTLTNEASFCGLMYLVFVHANKA